MNSYKALIIEDEINNVAILKYFLTKYCINIEVVGHASTINEAVSAIDLLEPDILFLDIHLNEGDAFDVLDRLKHINAQIIFVTSYNEYAIKAFKYNAIDYLLKPVVIEELILAVNKAVKNIHQQRYFDFNKLAMLSKTEIPVLENNEYIAIASIDKIDLLKASDVLYLESDSKYAIFHSVDGKKYTSSKNLLHFEKIIDSSRFFRVHHSYIINIEHVVRIIKKDGSYCELSNGMLIPIAKRKQNDFNRFLKIKS
ncbi:LytR/AlgR family response regulator transcription factor [Paenimyroides ceti]